MLVLPSAMKRNPPECAMHLEYIHTTSLWCYAVASGGHARWISVHKIGIHGVCRMSTQVVLMKMPTQGAAQERACWTR